MNDISRIEEDINALAEALILAEPEDLELLEEVCERFHRIHHWATRTSLPDVADAVRASAHLVERVIRREEPDPTASLDVAGFAVSILQSVVCLRAPSNQRIRKPEVREPRTRTNEQTGAPAESEDPT